MIKLSFHVLYYLGIKNYLNCYQISWSHLSLTLFIKKFNSWNYEKIFRFNSVFSCDYRYLIEDTSLQNKATNLLSVELLSKLGPFFSRWFSLWGSMAVTVTTMTVTMTCTVAVTMTSMAVTVTCPVAVTVSTFKMNVDNFNRLPRIYVYSRNQFLYA